MLLILSFKIRYKLIQPFIRPRFHLRKLKFTRHLDNEIIIIISALRQSVQKAEITIERLCHLRRVESKMLHIRSEIIKISRCTIVERKTSNTFAVNGFLMSDKGIGQYTIIILVNQKHYITVFIGRCTSFNFLSSRSKYSFFMCMIFRKR